MGVILGCLAAISIGLSDLFARRVVHAGNALMAAVAVTAVAIPTAAAAALLTGGSATWRDFGVGGLSGLGMAAGLVTYYRGLSRSSSTVVTPLVAVLAALIPLGVAAWAGDPMSFLALAGAAVAMAGLVLITVGGAPAAAADIRPGVVWGTVSGLAYGFGFAVVLAASPSAGAWPAVGQRVFGTAVLLGIALHRHTPVWPPRTVRTAAVLGGALAGLSTVFYLLGLPFDATATVITSSMFPAASVIVGRVFFNDSVSRVQVLGIAVVLGGVATAVTG